MRTSFFFLLVGFVVLSAADAPATAHILTPRLHHLRLGPKPEWDDFPKQAEGPRLVLRFQAEANKGEQTLILRQQDVRQTWRVLLNGKELGRLPPDENDMVIVIPISPGRLLAGENVLAIEQVGKVVDDIRVGEIVLDERPPSQVLSAATVEITALDVSKPDQPLSTPCRITVLNDKGALMTVGAVSGEGLAVRPGVLYSASGKARFGLPPGQYTILAGQGFGYGLDSVKIKVRAGDVIRKKLTICREVATPGYVSRDTHIHTLTYSGHGDAAVSEQVLAIAGEGIELAIATEHNLHVDYHAAALKQGVRKYFTPVVGNEVTTALGHFNVFPVKTDGPVPDFKAKDRKALFASIHRSRAKIVILNHPRDVHLGYRPFGPEHHIALTGENLDGWELQANAMEVINSGAHQSDMMRPVRDWMNLLNRGRYLTPIGASDSHDVARYFVGQARTYVRCRSDRPGNLDITEAITGLLQGRVMVGCGLLAEITVQDKFGPGDLVPARGEVTVDVRVLGPSWVQADKVELFANGQPIREAKISENKKSGFKWTGRWKLPAFRHDVHLVAVASGPPVRELYWPIARPYQATSTKVERRVLGISGAVWLDVDGDGKKSSAHDYARRLVDAAWPSVPKAIASLSDYDEAIAAQAAALLRTKGVAINDEPIRAATRKAGPHVERAFQAYFEAWRHSQVARNQQVK